MQYKYIKQDKNYEDYSSGRVIYGYSGATNFPVRLTQEIFEKCINYLKKQNKAEPYNIYDPFCGVAYTFTILGLFYPEKIKDIFVSDINQESLNFAEKNLELLKCEGIDKRIKEIESLIKEYSKESHKEASKIDIVISDIPYGKLTNWQKDINSNPTQKFLDNIKSILAPKSIVAISLNKKQEISHIGYNKIGTFKIGKRKVLFLTPIN
ncbi:MAG: methyltransferase domain-containing protein [Bacteroidetes bacterium]|nr:methyltransferase domain-containing protein [Bacteroidota bacterium]